MLTPEHDFRQPPDTCHTCPHNWHGLNCDKQAPQTPGTTWPTRRCGCKGPWASTEVIE